MRSPALKRTLDIVGASFGLALFALPMGLVALLIRWRMGSPVLFCQERPGLHGRPFSLFKFRTMTNAVDAQGRLLPDAERLTRLGSLLRNTSLDELPQLLNVLRGDMSLVGPRPLLMSYLPRYSPTQARRHEVRPGITGWSQIHGRNLGDWPTRLTQDVWYVDHWTLALDLRIVWRTVAVVFSREGVSEQGQATRSEFRGEN